MRDPSLEFAESGLGVGASIVAVFSAIFHAFAVLLSSTYILIILLIVTALMIPIVKEGDTGIEEIEHVMRGIVWPVWRDTARAIVNFIRRIYNPLICPADGLNWIAFGLLQDAVYPTLVECNPGPMFTALGDFIIAVLEDFLVNYILQEGFFSGPFDYTNVCNKWTIFWNAWIAVYTCSCNDLGILLQSLPIIPSVFWSAQWADPQTCCAVGNLTNAFMELINIVLTVVSQLLHAIFYLIDPQSPYAQLNFTRPNFYKFVGLLCDSGSCLMRSTENALQLFWDNYVPFPFVFDKYFCMLDTAFCFILKTANWIATLLINIDKVVQYPTDQFWLTDMKPLTIENLNIIGPLTAFAPIPTVGGTNFTITHYSLDTSNPFTPLGAANPMYGKLRLTECVCIFIHRTICDPTDNTTACFSTSIANLLKDFDFCCLTDSLTVLILDTVTSAIELTYHVAFGPTDFFILLDKQPFTTVMADDLLPIARCLVSVLTLIPDVGHAVQNLVVEVVRYLADMIDFLLRAIIGLASLPYYLIAIPNVPEFLTGTGIALNQFVAIQQAVIAQVPASFTNSLCLLLNMGFPIPPIPCTSCNLTGFIPLPPVTKKKRLRLSDPGGDPWSIAASAMGWADPEHAYLVTPLINYGKSDTNNPFELARMIRMNANDIVKRGVLPFPDHASVDRFVDEKKAKIIKKWGEKVTCKQLKLDEMHDRETRPHIWRYNVLHGKYDCPGTSNKKSGPSNRNEKLETSTRNVDIYEGNAFENMTDVQKREYETDYRTRAPRNEQSERLTVGPTVPPIVSCSSPTPDCFDLCCLFRALLELGAFTLEALARFFNGFIQYEKARYPGALNDFPYFTGELCESPFNTDCFESVLVAFIFKLFKVPTCICRFLNLIVPITPDNPRQDLCCAIQRVAELIACILMVIINAVKALALGASNGYSYYTMGFFYDDVSALFDVTLEVLDCACVLIRGTFPLNFIPGLQQAIDFDICCAPLALATSIVEALRAIVLTIISLATITVTPESYCFFRLDTTHGCPGTLDEIGIVHRVDVFLDSLLPLTDASAANSCLQNCGKDQGIGGVVPCICQLFNTLITWRDDPGLPVNCTLGSLNCQKVDLCCPFVKIGVGLNVLIKFINRGIAALWQSWEGGLPEFFIHYIFCDEEAGVLPCGTVGNQCAFTGLMPPTPNCACGTFTCGQLIPVINSLTDPAQGLISQCLCELVTLLDDLLVLVFDAIGSSWPGCFCSQITGTLRSGPYVAKEILVAIVGFLRKFPLPCYWNPAGSTTTTISGIPTLCTPQVDPGCECTFTKGAMNTVESSWIFSFLGPVANAMCVSVGNLMCFVNSIFFIPVGCLGLGEKFLGSTMRWGVDIVFRVVAFIEGFVRQFTDPMPSCVGPEPMCQAPTGGSYAGVSAIPLGNLLTSLLSWPVDMFIGDSVVSCTRICPKGTLQQPNITLKCQCYQLSPLSNGKDFNHVSVWAPYIDHYDIFANPVYGCTIVAPTVFGPADSISRMVGTNGISGVGAQFPACSSFLDYQLGDPGYPGTCANYSLCRPDTLPSCGQPIGWPDDLIASNYMGPIDGQIQGLIRYIGCAIGPSGFSIVSPLLYFNSIIWQLYGAIVRFVVSFVIFLLSFFTLTGGCSCWDSPDPRQGDTIVKHIQGGGFDIGFCYACPDAHGPCGGEVGFPVQCQPHCPVFQGTSNPVDALALCIQKLETYSYSGVWPTNSANDLCGGYWEEGVLYSNCGSDPGCRARRISELSLQARNRVSCPVPYCQVNGTASIPLHPDFSTFAVRGSEENSNPLVLCSFFNLINRFLDVVHAFIAIFSTPLMLPDQKRSNIIDGEQPVFVGPVSRKNMSDFLDMIRPNKKPKNVTATRIGTRVESIETAGGYDKTIPSAPELVLLALFDFDSSDGFTDPVSFVCRNFYMPSHCIWTQEHGVIPTVGRNRKHMPAHLRDKRDADQTMTVDEILSTVTERFNGTSVCDQAIQERANMPYDSMPHPYMERWVGCVEKRIQGERVSAATGQVVTTDIMYSTQAPLKIFHNIMSGWKKKRLEARIRQEEERRRKRSEIDNDYPDLEKNLMHRAALGRRYLQTVKGINPYSPMFEAIIQADEIWYKYSIGYYGYMINRALKHYKRGDWNWPSPEDASRDLAFSIQNLKFVATNQPYMEVITGMHHNAVRLINFAREVTDYGVVKYVREAKQSYDENIRQMRARNQPNRAALLDKFKRMPIYRWWSMPSNDRNKGLLTPFFQHLNNVINHRRRVWNETNGAFTVFTADLKAMSVKDRIVKRWTTPVWTPKIIENWSRVGRVFHYIYETIFPGSLTEEERRRFLFDGNCALVTRSVDTITKVADYCANVYMYNMNFTRKLGCDPYIHYTRSEFIPDFFSNGTCKRNYLLKTSPHRVGTFFSQSNYFGRYNLTSPSDPHAYIRPVSTRSYVGVGHMHPSRLVSRNVYKRAYMTGPAGFNFLDWITDLVSNILHSWFDFDSSSWIADAKYWLHNPNTDESFYPDVGLRYWLLFFLRCEFPEYLNCSQGIGLKDSMLWVSAGLLIAMIVGYYALSPIAFILEIFTVPILWLVLVGAVGFHFSPRCAIMFPTLTGVSFTLPMCLADEILAVADFFIRQCYVGFLIPPCMVSGETCPSDPNAFIDIANCRVVGVSDGIQNLLFIGYIALGQWFVNAMTFFTTSTIGLWIPSLNTYMQTTLNGFKLASDAQRCREWWCFAFTAPVIALPLLATILGMMFISILIPSLLSLGLSSYYMFSTSPLGESIPGNDTDIDEDDIEQQYTMVPSKDTPISVESVQRYIRFQLKQ